MDFSAPYRVISPTLEGPILRALAGVEIPLTRSQILAQMENASEAGVRKALFRLVTQGIITESRIGSRYTYAANRDHLMWPAVEGMFRPCEQLREQVSRLVASWRPKPRSVELFGSVAQGTADEGSDLDILVVRPMITASDRERWDEQIGDLHDHLVRWTGNDCDIVVLDGDDLVAAIQRSDPVLRSRMVNLAGRHLAEIMRSLTKITAERAN